MDLKNMDDNEVWLYMVRFILEKWICIKHDMAYLKYSRTTYDINIYLLDSLPVSGVPNVEHDGKSISSRPTSATRSVDVVLTSISWWSNCYQTNKIKVVKETHQWCYECND